MMSVHRNAAVRPPRSPRRPAAPVEVTQVPPAALKAAKAILARSNYSRIECQRDGSVIVR